MGRYRRKGRSHSRYSSTSPSDFGSPDGGGNSSRDFRSQPSSIDSSFGSDKETTAKPSDSSRAVSFSDSDEQFTFSSGRHRHGAFGTIDQDRVKDYLTDYRNGAERIFNVNQDDVNADDDTVQTGKWRHTNDRNRSRFGSSGSDDPTLQQSPSEVWIAGHTFPALTEENLRAPYLALPVTLTPKQRRFIHDACVEVGIYHCGSGHGHHKSGDRCVVISIHSDGFHHVVPKLSKPHGIPVRRCLPWYYQSEKHMAVKRSRGLPMTSGKAVTFGDNKVQDKNDTTNGESNDATRTDTPTKSNSNECREFVLQSTKAGRELIETFIDQPGQCLRDDHDTLDFAALEKDDLSSISAPSLDQKDGTWLLVDSAERMQQCVTEMVSYSPKAIGFDLEMYNPSKYTQITCLLQLSTDYGKAYVIDVLAPGVWDTVPLLAPFFADPSIVKIGHHIGGMDVPSLHRDFGIFVVNAFDTYEAAQHLRLKEKGLASICSYYGLVTGEDYSKLKKECQRADWRVRPLAQKMIIYGLYDVHCLIKLRILLMRDLTRGEFWDKEGMDQVEEARMVAKALAATLRSFQRAEDDEDGMSDAVSSNASDDDGYFTPPTAETCFAYDEDGDVVEVESSKHRSVFTAKDLRMHLGLMRVIGLSQTRCLAFWKRGSENAMKHDALISMVRRAALGLVSWKESNMELYAKLVAWRREVAREEGTLPDFVCTLELLVQVSWKRPMCESALRRLSYFLPEFLEDESSNYMRELLSIVRSSVQENDDDIALKDSISSYESSQNERRKTRALPGRTVSKRRFLSFRNVTVVAVGVATIAIVLARRKRR